MSAESPYQQIVYSRRGAFSRLAGFIAVFFICMMVLQILNASAFCKVLAGSLGADPLCIQELLGLWICLVSIGTIQGRSFPSFLKDIGFTYKFAPIEIIVGFIIGLLFIGTGFGALYLLNGFTITTVDWSINILPQVVFFFVGALVEELVFRGFLFSTAEKGWGTMAGVIISSLLFGFAHMLNPIPGASDADKLYSCLLLSLDAGLPLVGAFLLTRRIWFATGMHWAWNVLEGPVFGFIVSGVRFTPSLMTINVSDNLLLSGGLFGPEASVPLCVTGTTFGCGLLYFAWKKGQFKKSRWNFAPEQPGP